MAGLALSATILTEDELRNFIGQTTYENKNICAELGANIKLTRALRFPYTMKKVRGLIICRIRGTDDSPTTTPVFVAQL